VRPKVLFGILLSQKPHISADLSTNGALAQTNGAQHISTREDNGLYQVIAKHIRQ
jgi:hypothetical protein